MVEVALVEATEVAALVGAMEEAVLEEAALVGASAEAAMDHPAMEEALVVDWEMVAFSLEMKK